jgi:hypothetical protein
MPGGQWKSTIVASIVYATTLCCTSSAIYTTNFLTHPRVLLQANSRGHGACGHHKTPLFKSVVYIWPTPVAEARKERDQVVNNSRVITNDSVYAFGHESVTEESPGSDDTLQEKPHCFQQQPSDHSFTSTIRSPVNDESLASFCLNCVGMDLTCSYHTFKVTFVSST